MIRWWRQVSQSPAGGRAIAWSITHSPDPVQTSVLPPSGGAFGTFVGRWYFTLYSRVDADLPAFARLSAPLPARRHHLARLRLAGDGDDRRDPAADRRRRRRDRIGDAATTSCRWRSRSSAPASCGSGSPFVRRLIAGKVSLAVEFDLRQRIYEHLQRLELGFFDGQQTGQLMSRATVDLQSIRFFLGYGLIFLTQNVLTILLAGGGDVRASTPGWRRSRCCPMPFVVFTATRYNRLSRPALQEVQQRIAELTAEAEESVSGHPDRQGLRPRGTHARPASATRSPGCSTRTSTRPGCAPSTRR